MAVTDPIATRTAEGEFDQKLPDLIVPEWELGEATIERSSFTIDAEGAALTADGQVNPGVADEMLRAFDEIGLVYVVNTGLTELGDMRTVAKTVLDVEMEYEGGSNPRENIEPNVYEVGAPLVAWLHYHHEMAYVGQSTTKLAFMAKHAVEGKGATYVSDNVAATDALLGTEFGQKLAELGLCYHRLLTDRESFKDRLEIGVYNHWQLSLGTEDPDEAEQRAHDRGLITEWGDDRLLRTRYYVSAFEYFPPLDRNLLYSSVADHGMWFDTWPLVQHLPYGERPLNLTFGDDTPLSAEERQEFVTLYDRFGMPINWSVGEIVVVCNYRFAHGRPSIHLEGDEQRELGVLLGEKYNRLGALPDKW